MARSPELPVLGSAGSPKRTRHPCEAAAWKRSRHQRPRGQALKVWGEDLPVISSHSATTGWRGFSPRLWRLGRGPRMEQSSGTHGVGRVKVTQADRGGEGSEREEGVQGSLRILAWGTGQWSGEGEAGEMTRLGCYGPALPQACLGDIL